MHRASRHAARCFLLTLPLALGACESQPERRPPTPPAEIQPRLVSLALHALMDEDRNGYPDTIPVTFYLWDPRHPLPVWHPGTITFRLHDADERLLAEWTVPPEVLLTARRRDQVGAVHALTLDIRDATTDELPTIRAQLSAVFVGEDGQVARSERPLAVPLGR